MPAIPVLVQVLIVFALVVAASAKKMHLGLAAVLGGFLFAALRGIPIGVALGAALAEILDPDTILLLLLITAIMALSTAMKTSGALAAFSRSVARVAPSPRASMALTPLLIGTLPMPGGAILSAPLVDALDPDRLQGADGLSAVNYWFRHCLELSWPLFPAFILTSTLSGIAAPRLILLNLYTPFLFILLGELFVMKRGAFAAKATMGAKVEGASVADYADGQGSDTESAQPVSRPFSSKLYDLGGFIPLGTVLCVYAALDALCRVLVPGLGLSEAGAKLVGRYLPIFSGIGAGCLYVARTSLKKGAFRGSVNAGSLKLALVIGGIRVFAALLESGGVAQASADELAAWGIPAIAAAVILPFVSGLVTGVGFGYVGIAFPIVFGLFPTGGSMPLEAVVVLAGAFGFAGMMLSPLHVCMVVTAEHFGTGLTAVIKRFALPLSLYLAMASAYVAALAKFLK